ncbi:hypothetical protein ACOME3_009367 [Neoechinorhynchus agilis]
MSEVHWRTGEFFQLKEIEKISQKRLGINSNLVKEIVTGLVADNLVDTDRIGQSHYYWSYPSKVVNILEMEETKIKELIREFDEKVHNVEVLLEKQQEKSNSASDRTQKLQILESLKEKKRDLIGKYALVCERDPIRIEEIQSQCKDLIELINEWTDNVLIVKQWLKQKFHVEDSIINKQFNIPADLDVNF